MKKTASAILAVIMILLLCPFGAFAADKGNGDTISVTVSVGSYDSIVAGGVDFNYDSDVLEFVCGNLYVQGAFGEFNNQGTAAFMSMKSFSVSGSLADATFRVRDDAEIGSSTSISASVVLTPEDGKDIRFSVSLGTVTVVCTHKNKQSHAQQDATCKEGGYTAGEYCPDCETWVSGHTEIPVSTTHSYGKWEKISDTQHKHRCSVCEKEETENHTWDSGKVTTPATHTKTGVKTLTCTKCGATKTETIPVTTEHNYGAWAKVNDTQHKHSCECGAEETENHTWDSGKVTTPATHTTTGVKTYTCTKCSATKTETIEKTTEHNYGAWTKISDTQHKHICECGAEETENHTWDSGKVTTPATHTTAGVKTLTCTKCDATKTETIEKTTEHNYGAWTKISDTQHKHTCECGVEEIKDHTWDGGKVTKQATCKDEGVTTYTCTGCGATKTEPIAVTTTHNYGKWIKVDDNTHKHICPDCGKEETASHNWGAGVTTKPATHMAEGVTTYTCSDCGATKTSPIAKLTEHEFGVWEKKDENTHKHTCECGEEETEAHTWNTGAVTKEPTCKDEGVKTYTCTGCGATKTEKIAKLTTHTYTNDCDPDCNVCGATREVTHQYRTEWSYNGTSHWHTCTVCGVREGEAAHTPGPAATETAPQVCTACGYIIAPALGHTHNYATTYTSDENGHWHACSGCSEKKDYAAHVYDNGCDKTCNICGYERATEHKYDGTWHTDETGHWHECTECGEKKDFEAHVPGKEATEDTPQTCVVCDYVIHEAIGHTHDFGTDWICDENAHWHECKCGEKSDYAAHDYEIAVEDNSVVYTCKCGYIKTQPVEKDEPVVIAGEQSETGTETATVSSELIGQITENTEHGILIELGSGTTVEYDKSALSTIASSAAGNDVTLAVENVGSDAPGMNEQQKQTVADLPAGSTVISLTLKAGETEIHDFGGGKATVTVPFTLPEGWKAEEVIVYRIEDDGTKTPMNTSFSDGSVTWETDGHSYYVVSRSTEKTTPVAKLGALPIIIIAVIAVMALAGVTLLVVKKKKN